MNQRGSSSKEEIDRLRAEAIEKDRYIAALEAAVREKEDILRSIHDSLGWKGLSAYYRLRDRILPIGSRRRSLVKTMLRTARRTERPGFIGLMRESDYCEALEGFKKNPIVMIELSSRCNFHCPYCVSSDSTRQKGYMDRKLFEHVLSQASEITKHPLRFHVDGEPMLHPEFFEMALSANKAGHKLGIASNGSCLKKDYLEIDMDLLVNISSSQPEHEKRTSIDYEAYLKRIKEYLWDWKKGQSKQRIFLKIYFNENERKMPEVMEEKRGFAHSFAKQLEIDSSNCWSNDENTPPLIYTKSNGAFLMISFQQVTEGGLYPVQNDIPLGSSSLPIDWGFCDSPWKVLSIFADGSIGFCCVDITGKTAFTSPDEIWQRRLKDVWLHHPALTKIREDLVAGKVQLPVCQKCLTMEPTRELYIFRETFPRS